MRLWQAQKWQPAKKREQCRLLLLEHAEILAVKNSYSWMINSYWDALIYFQDQNSNNGQLSFNSYCSNTPLKSHFLNNIWISKAAFFLQKLLANYLKWEDTELYFFLPLNYLEIVAGVYWRSCQDGQLANFLSSTW